MGVQIWMITKLQRQALLFIEAEIERSGGVAPTVREIADHPSYRRVPPWHAGCSLA